ncbi:MAG: enoyl-CoA hydratase/isomerase family protein, partial [Rhodospirillaceae bacterium]|nr:enoyl-CoA hydratase/isomerase family protein [Rhodospirillaceae bacterium]
AVMDPDAVRLTKQAINGAFDAMGLRQALEINLDLAVEIEATETPSRKQFKEIAAKDGLKAALAWREGRMNQDG